MKGLTQWKLQRFSALYLLFYFAYVGTMIYVHGPLMTYDFWSAFMLSMHMTVATFFAIALLTVHAWIGVRNILTDYIKCSSMRTILLGSYALVLGLAAISGVLVFWS